MCYTVITIIYYPLLKMFDRLVKIAKSDSGTEFSYITKIEHEIRQWSEFFHEVENWRDLELNYTSKLSEIVSNMSSKPSIINIEFQKIFNIIIDSHKELFNKINYDIMLVNVETSENLIE